MQCPNCKLEFHPHSRSNPQNKYYWGVVLKILADETGYTTDEMHELMKYKFNSRHIEAGFDEMNVGMSTASLQKMEFEAYINKVIMWASKDLGVMIPPPGEK